MLLRRRSSTNHHRLPFSLLACIVVALLIFLSYRAIVVQQQPPSAIASRRRAYQSPARFRQLLLIDNAAEKSLSSQCRMSTCFERCRHRAFRVYVYPTSEPISPMYTQFLEAIRQSHYYTPDPSEACLFVPSVDTLDRDPLSERYAPKLQLPGTGALYRRWWNGGRNHLVFNLYAGSYPDYREDELGFDAGKAILAKASMSEQSHRAQFDVSLPLPSDGWPLKGGNESFLHRDKRFYDVRKRHLLTFKGKRYLHGFGSLTRDSLHHLNNDNNDDVILLTTCIHGKQWRRYKDARCESDQAAYARYDYRYLLENSTFCLVPRGRRLASYRFHEALQAGCVPVVMSRDWVLPFDEVLQWSEGAALIVDERLLFELPEYLQQMLSSERGRRRVMRMRQRGAFLWSNYFASVEKIVLTTLQIIEQRVMRAPLRPSVIWWNDEAVGAARSVGSAVFSSSAEQRVDEENRLFRPMRFSAAAATKLNVVLRFSQSQDDREVGELLDAWDTVLHSLDGVVERVILLDTSETERLRRLASGIGAHPVVIPWKLPFVIGSGTILSSALSNTSCVLLVDAANLLLADEIRFGLRVWSAFPNRLVGFASLSHYRERYEARYRLVGSATSGEQSIVQTEFGVFLNRLYVLTQFQLPNASDLACGERSAESVVGAVMQSHIVGALPPIRLPTSRHERSRANVVAASRRNDDALSEVRRAQERCLNRLARHFGEPLLLARSRTRLEATRRRPP